MTEPMFVCLVRDRDGKPRFDLDPRTYPEPVQGAFKAQMTPAEIEEYFECRP